MARWLVLLLSAALVACARTPTLPSTTDCQPPSPMTVMLRVEQQQSEVVTWVVHGAREPAGYTLVAVNPVGVPLFTAVQEADQLTVRKRPAYRGPDPQWVLWGLYWWSSKRSLSGCVADAGFWERKEHGHRDILRDQVLYWRWDRAAPDHFELPREGLEVQVRETDNP